MVLRTRQTIVFHTNEELVAFRREHGIEHRELGGPTVDHSFVYAPLVTGNDAIGLIAIGKQPPHAFAPNDVNLIGTVAASLSVALQNVQSFEAERQRAAELAIINAVQQALAGELNIQGVYDAVGDKMREMFPGSGRRHPRLRPGDRLGALSRTRIDDGRRIDAARDRWRDEQGFGAARDAHRQDIDHQRATWPRRMRASSAQSCRRQATDAKVAARWFRCMCWAARRAA